MGDWIGLIERAYSLEGDLDQWLAGVVEAGAGALDRGGGLAGWVYSHAANDWRVLAVASRGPDPFFEALTRAAIVGLNGGTLRRLLSGPAIGGTLSSVPHAERPVDRMALTQMSHERFQDAFGLIAPTATGLGVVIGGPLPAKHKTTSVEIVRHARVAAHLAAGLRLRSTLEGAAESTEEAVLDPDARIHDASGSAHSSRARDWLRHAVRQRERALGTERRRDPDEALAIWEGLVAGRWSLVDRFEHDGRRYVVAHANDPELGDPRGLSRRERQIAEYVGLGRSFKEIAYLLGLGPSAIANGAARACVKLGLRGRTELARFFSPHGPRARLAAIDVAGERMAVGSVPAGDSTVLARLSEAERAITNDLLAGFTVPAIAMRREASPHTVATQVKSIYDKLGVGSRLELVARLAASSE